MCFKIIISVLVALLLHRNVVEGDDNIFLSYHYEKGSGLTKAVCDSKARYIVPEENVHVDLKHIEDISFAVCNLSKNNTTYIAVDKFPLITTLYRGKINQLVDGVYNCLFYVKNTKGNEYAPLVKLQNEEYILIECSFELKIRQTNEILLDITVNGYAITPLQKTSDNVIQADYKYTGDEKLKVICKKRTKRAGSVFLSFNGEISQNTYGTTMNIVQAEYDVVHPQATGPRFTLKCVLSNNYYDILETYNIDFAPVESPVEYMKVEGLVMDRVVVKNDYRSYLFYKYTDIEEIYLKCAFDCLKGYCKLEMYYMDTLLNGTFWRTANSKVEVGHPFILTPQDNSSSIKCVSYKKPCNQILTEYIYVSLWHIAPTESSKITTLSTTLPTTLSTTKSKDSHGASSTSPTIPSSSSSEHVAIPELNQTTSKRKFPIWAIGGIVIVLLLIILVIVMVSVRLKRRRAPAKPETVEMDTVPTPRPPLEVPEPEYEEIPAVVPDPKGNGRKLRMIPGIKLNPKTGMLIVNGKSIDVGNLLEEPQYEEVREPSGIVPPPQKSKNQRRVK